MGHLRSLKRNVSKAVLEASAALQTLGFIPKPLHGVEVRIFKRCTIARKSRRHEPESTNKLCIGLAERRLWIDANMSCKIDAGEQQIAHFLADRRALFDIVFNFNRLPELAHLLADLFEHRLNIGPVEPHPCGTALQLHRA